MSLKSLLRVASRAREGPLMSPGIMSAIKKATTIIITTTSKIVKPSEFLFNCIFLKVITINNCITLAVYWQARQSFYACLISSKS